MTPSSAHADVIGYPWPVTERLESKIADALEERARDALKGLEQGLMKADAVLKAPDGSDLAALLGSTDLPELPADGALGSLGVRLDREADLHRNVALRELGRVAWVDRITLIVVLLAFVGEAAIAACATASTLVGVIEGRSGLFALAALILAGGAAGFAAIVSSSRRIHKDLAMDSLARARAIEDELFRLGVVMEWRAAGPTLFQEALARLERRDEKRDE